MAGNNRLRFGILGAAHIVPNALVKPAEQVPGVELTAIAARDPARARTFAHEHGIARVHATYDDLLSDPEVNVIYNPLPNSLHCKWSIAALQAGKHVLCEKPIASNADEAGQMAKVAEETGLMLVEAFHYRYHPLADRVHEIMHDGSLGRLLHVEGQFSVPIPAPNIRYDWSLAGGATMADLELEGGATARMICSMKLDSALAVSFSARGERGELTVTNPVGPHWGHQLIVKAGGEEKSETVPGDTSYTHQLRAFAAAMRGESSFPTGAREGIINMRVIDDVYRAAGLPPRGK